jgi:hypothetical protein
VKKPKPKEPTVFDGKRGNWKKFIIQLLLYFNHYEDYYINDPAGDRRRCAYLLQLMEGETVANWAYGLLSTMGQPHESPFLRDWPQLIIEATRLWGPINEVQTAREKLERLRQTKSVSEYYSEFLQWAVLTAYNEEALAAIFYKGLKEAIKDMMTHVDRPDTVAELRELAMAYENRILTRMRERGSTNKFGSNQSNREKTLETRIAAMTAEERSKLMKEGRCFRCKKPGHMANSCPDKPVFQTKKTEETEPKGEGEIEQKSF